MIKSTRIPALNSLRFIPANDALQERYNTWPADRGFYAETVKSFMSKSSYLQKVSADDLLTVYFDSLAATANIYILDANGAIVDTIAITPAEAVEGNTYDVGSSSYIYNTYYETVRMSDYVTLGSGRQKIYTVAIECVYDPMDANESTYFVSEPVLVRNGKFTDTVLLEVTHDTNDYDVLFEQLSPIFRMRVEGALMPADQASHDVAFEDQLRIVTPLSSVPYSLYNLLIGGMHGVPPYLRTALNFYTACSSVRIDGIRLSKDTNAKWSTTGSNAGLKRSASITLRQVDQQGEYASGGDVLLVELPHSGSTITYPFASNFIGINGFANIVYRTATVVDDSTELAAWVAALNAYAATYGVSGEFVVDGVNLVYRCGFGEVFTANRVMYIWNTAFTATVATSGAADYSFQYAARAGSSMNRCNMVVDWGDGGTDSLNGSGTLATISHDYAGAGSYIMRVFHSGSNNSTLWTPGKLVFNHNDADAKMTSIAASGKLPDGLYWFEVKNQNLGSAISTLCLRYCSASLVTLKLWYNNTTDFAEDVFLMSGGFGFNYLQTVDISNNKLGTTELNAIVDAFQARVTVSNGGTFLLDRQTPTAGPSGSRVTFLDYIVSTYGWSVSRD